MHVWQVILEWLDFANFVYIAPIENYFEDNLIGRKDGSQTTTASIALWFAGFIKY